MNTTVGTCSICGGRVSVPLDWLATVPPTPKCERCGAVEAQPHGPVIPMQPSRPRTISGGRIHVRTDGTWEVR